MLPNLPWSLNGTVIVYEGHHVTEIRPISEVARGWLYHKTKCQQVSTVLMGSGCITVWVTKNIDRWACVFTYLCVHSESKMFHSPERDLEPICGSLDPTSPHTKRHLELFIRFCMTDAWWSTNKSDRQRDRPTTLPVLWLCVRRGRKTVSYCSNYVLSGR